MIDFEREPPHNFEAEQALLGAILVNNAAYQGVADFLRPEHFADPLHGKLYEALSKLMERGEIVNAITLKTYAESMPGLREAGGPTYLARMASASVHALHAPSVGQVITDAANRRRLIKLGDDMLAAAYRPEPGDSAVRQIERLERALYDVASGESEGAFGTFDDALARTLVAAEAAHQRSGRLAGVSTGFGSLDRLLGGLHPSDLVILAGRPSMGKTALATNIAFAAARAHATEADGEGGRQTIDAAAVAFFSLEMSDEQLVTRILAEQAGVPSERVRRGQLSGVELDRVQCVATRLRGLPLYIDPTPALSIAALRTRARRLKRQHGIGLVVVDYLQLLDASNRRDGRVQEVSEISRGLKTLAKELDVPVLALSQLNREVEKRENKRPLLSDLRDSGTIEQDADVVMFVYREQYYLERGSAADRARVADVAGQAELLIAKHRHGDTGIVRLRFDSPLTKFTDAEEGVQE
jgi:replicative DNA helicase